MQSQDPWCIQFPACKRPIELLRDTGIHKVSLLRIDVTDDFIVETQIPRIPLPVPPGTQTNSDTILGGIVGHLLRVIVDRTVRIVHGVPNHLVCTREVFQYGHVHIDITIRVDICECPFHLLSKCNNRLRYPLRAR